MRPSALGLLIILVSFVTFSAAGMAIVAAVFVRLPEDYFSRTGPHRTDDVHPLLRWSMLILKNIVGAVIVVMGIVLTMPGVPGPGILTILLGMMMMDFPGKRRFERWLISRPGVFAAVNRLRQRYGRPAFTL
jgi:archaellum biogenesis protein FlaJ (TadC family)